MSCRRSSPLLKIAGAGAASGSALSNTSHIGAAEDTINLHFDLIMRLVHMEGSNGRLRNAKERVAYGEKLVEETTGTVDANETTDELLFGDNGGDLDVSLPEGI